MPWHPQAFWVSTKERPTRDAMQCVYHLSLSHWLPRKYRPASRSIFVMLLHYDTTSHMSHDLYYSLLNFRFEMLPNVCMCIKALYILFGMQRDMQTNAEKTQVKRPIIQNWTKSVLFHRKRIEKVENITNEVPTDIEPPIKKNSKHFKMMRASYYIEIENFVKWIKRPEMKIFMRGLAAYDTELGFFTAYLDEHKSYVNDKYRHLYRIFNSKNGNFTKFRDTLMQRKVWDYDRERRQNDERAVGRNN